MRELTSGDEVSFDGDAVTTDGMYQVWDKFKDLKLTESQFGAGGRLLTATDGDPRSRLERFADWLLGIKYLDTPTRNEVVDVHVIDLVAPPGGTAKVTYSRSGTSKDGGSLKVAGSGGGTSFETTWSEEFTFAAPPSGTMRSYIVEVAVTVHRFEQIGGMTFTVVDVAPIEHRFVVRDYPIVPIGPNPTVIRQIPLSRSVPASPTDLFESKLASSQTESWDVSAGLSAKLGGVAVDLTATFESSSTRSVETTFELAYGADYEVVRVEGETQLSPRVVIA